VRLPELDYLEPRSVAEACALLAEDPPGSAPFAGGTDILVNLRGGSFAPRRLVSLRRIEELHDIAFSEGAGLSIGAMVTVNRVARSEAVQAHYPGLVEAALCLAADQVRNQATVAGNLCMAVPSADMAPILLAWDARLRVASPAGTRAVPLREFFVGPRRTVLGPAEVVTAIEVPPPVAGVGDANRRQGGRASLSLPVASAAAVVRMEGEVCHSAAVALGAVAPTPLYVAQAGECMAGNELSPDVLEEAGALAGAAVRPIDDVRASRAYRIELVKVLVRRAIAAAAERARAARTVSDE
jgi:CO/xanthine dehydrogenase FAD-binding subunit